MLVDRIVFCYTIIRQGINARSENIDMMFFNKTSKKTDEPDHILTFMRHLDAFCQQVGIHPSHPVERRISLFICYGTIFARRAAEALGIMYMNSRTPDIISFNFINSGLTKIILLKFGLEASEEVENHEWNKLWYPTMGRYFQSHRKLSPEQIVSILKEGEEFHKMTTERNIELHNAAMAAWHAFHLDGNSKRVAEALGSAYIGLIDWATHNQASQ